MKATVESAWNQLYIMIFGGVSELIAPGVALYFVLKLELLSVFLEWRMGYKRAFFVVCLM